MVYKSSSIAPTGSSSGTGGGTVSAITSSGGTIAITNPAGPTTNIDANLATAGAAGIVQPDNVTITINGAGVISAATGGTGTVTSVSGVTANGFAFSIANPTTTPAITAKTTINGILQGNGTAISAVSAGGIPTSLLSSNSITVSGVSGVTGGGSVALGSAITLGMAGNTANTLAGYNSSGVFSDVSIGSNLSLSGGILNGTVSPASVSSVFGRTGAVVATAGDYGFSLISGTAAVSQGGTGAASFTAHSVLLGGGASAVSATTTGTSGRLLIDQGNADPAFKIVSGDATITNTGAISVTQIGGITGVSTTATQTLTNKRITKRVLALSANSGTPAINTDSYDVVHITAQTSAISSFTTNLTGSPVDGDTLRISVTGTGAISLAFGASFEASTITLPTTTVSTSRLDTGFFWNTETTKWRIVALA